jgi:hypothetical protein
VLAAAAADEQDVDLAGQLRLGHDGSVWKTNLAVQRGPDNADLKNRFAAPFRNRGA